jgi:hypothetical protein
MGKSEAYSNLISDVKFLEIIFWRETFSLAEKYSLKICIF